MGSKGPPGCLEKRKILNQSTVSLDTLKTWGDMLFEMAHWSDAIDFYAKAGDGDSLEKVMGMAIEEGDLFLFTRACRALGVEPRAEDLQALADHARRLGKVKFADQALKLAGLEMPDAAETGT